MAMYNAGYQANLQIAALESEDVSVAERLARAIYTGWLGLDQQSRQRSG